MPHLFVLLTWFMIDDNLEKLYGADMLSCSMWLREQKARQMNYVNYFSKPTIWYCCLHPWSHKHALGTIASASKFGHAIPKRDDPSQDDHLKPIHC